MPVAPSSPKMARIVGYWGGKSFGSASMGLQKQPRHLARLWPRRAKIPFWEGTKQRRSAGVKPVRQVLEASYSVRSNTSQVRVPCSCTFLREGGEGNGAAAETATAANACARNRKKGRGWFCEHVGERKRERLRACESLSKAGKSPRSCVAARQSGEGTTGRIWQRVIAIWPSMGISAPEQHRLKKI